MVQNSSTMVYCMPEIWECSSTSSNGEHGNGRKGSGGRGSCYHEGSVSSLSRVHNQAEAILSPVLAEAATFATLILCRYNAKQQKELLEALAVEQLSRGIPRSRPKQSLLHM